MVAEGAIRENAGRVSTHHMWQPLPVMTGGKPGLATHRAAGFLVCGSQKKAPTRSLFGAKAGKI